MTHPIMVPVYILVMLLMVFWIERKPDEVIVVPKNMEVKKGDSLQIGDKTYSILKYYHGEKETKLKLLLKSRE